MNDYFPFSDIIKVERQSLSYDDVTKKLLPYVSAERLQKLQDSIDKRSLGLSIVTENVYDNGNINAVMRTAEALGVLDFHIIESQKTKIANRVTQGADKWLAIGRHTQTRTCLKKLKANGFTLVATALGEKSVSMFDLDFTKPMALILGNEKDGVSEETLELADINCNIPTVGLSQSFNISVAGAILISNIIQRQKGFYLSEVQKQILLGHYLYRAQNKADRLVLNT